MITSSCASRCSRPAERESASELVRNIGRDQSRRRYPGLHGGVNPGPNGARHRTTETAESCNTAFERLSNRRISIVICERDLADGTWLDSWNTYGRPPKDRL